MKHGWRLLLSLLLAASLAACSLGGDSPERAARDWLDAQINQDGNRLIERTCLSEREAAQLSGAMTSALSLLAGASLGSQLSLRGDISDVDFAAQVENGQARRLRVTGEMRVAVLALSVPVYMDETWLMVHENGKWRWCGHASQPNSWYSLLGQVVPAYPAEVATAASP